MRPPPPPRAPAEPQPGLPSLEEALAEVLRDAERVALHGGAPPRSAHELLGHLHSHLDELGGYTRRGRVRSKAKAQRTVRTELLALAGTVLSALAAIDSGQLDH